jgi:ADP-dependent phosphofructokinase/glucokinase
MTSSDIVLGLGGTVDYEIEWESSVLEALVAEYGIHADELDAAAPIADERALVVSLLGLLRSGSGGERYVASSGIVERFAARFERRITLGGTGVRAALAMRVLGVTSTLHLVSIDDHVRRLLPEGCPWISSATHDSTDPHLIVQFPTGARVRVPDSSGAVVDLVAAHPNRLIYSNDPPNQTLYLSDQLPAALAAARIFLISGFNSMRDAAALTERLDELRTDMAALPSNALVMYEDSGFHMPGFSAQVRAALLDRIDVYSLNEDELEGYLDRRVDLLDPVQVRSALHDIRAVVPARTLLVHTKHWSAALGDEAERHRSALAGGIQMASTRYRYGDGFRRADYEAMAREHQNPGGIEVARELARTSPATVVIPAYLLNDPAPTTIGLGDTFVGGFIAATAMRGSSDHLL